MSLKILLVSATRPEVESLDKNPLVVHTDSGYKIGNSEVNLLITGIGSVSTSWTLTKWLASNAAPDVIINVGIAGSFREDIRIGEVVMPVTDCFADAGIEDGEIFLTLFESGLVKPDEFPFSDGQLKCDNIFTAKIKKLIKPVNAITVNTSTGSEAALNNLRNKFNPDIETMEGATFFYICSREKIPFLTLRAISNMVERRNKRGWNIPLALRNLSEKIIEVIVMLN